MRLSPAALHSKLSAPVGSRPLNPCRRDLLRLPRDDILVLLVYLYPPQVLGIQLQLGARPALRHGLRGVPRALGGVGQLGQQRHDRNHGNWAAGCCPNWLSGQRPAAIYQMNRLCGQPWRGKRWAA